VNYSGNRNEVLALAEVQCIGRTRQVRDGEGGGGGGGARLCNVYGLRQP